MPRARPPAWLKTLLLPAWNSSHRLAWTVFDYGGALLHRRYGRCEVCGRFTLWLYRRRVVPVRLEELWGLTPRLAEALARKESMDCSRCGAKLRGRTLARALLQECQVDRVQSLAEWVRRPEVRALRVAEMNRIDGLHEVLGRLPNFAFSEFQAKVAPGAVVEGVRSEDLTRLTYPDASFDLILTSETLEHVPDLVTALSEIRRVLRPGGRHVFTVPLLPVVPRTYARSVIRPDGSLEHKAPRICHPGGDTGYPVFTEFGADLPALLERAGFEVEMLFGPPSESDLGQVFVCTRPVEEG